MGEIKIKNDKDWLMELLKREIKKCKEKNNNNKHNYNDRIELLQKTIEFVEKNFEIPT